MATLTSWNEHAARGWVPERHAVAVKEMLRRHHVNLVPRGRFSLYLARFVAGADCFNRQSNGATIASQYSALGFSLRSANTDRVNGWSEIVNRLGDPTAGIPPRLFIHRRCSRLIECLPTLQHDPNRPEDVIKTDPDENGHGGDDSADACRYLVATRPRTIRVLNLRGL